MGDKMIMLSTERKSNIQEMVKSKEDWQNEMFDAVQKWDLGVLIDMTQNCLYQIL